MSARDPHWQAADVVDDVAKRDGLDGLRELASDPHADKLVREQAERVIAAAVELDPERRHEWWHRMGEPVYTQELLQRSGALPQDDEHDAAARLREYREKPWKWSRERLIALRIESIFVRYDIPRARGWTMSLAEVAAYAEENTRDER